MAHMMDFITTWRPVKNKEQNIEFYLLEWLVKKGEKKLKLKIKTNSVVVVDIMQLFTAFKTITDIFQSIFPG